MSVSYTHLRFMLGYFRSERYYEKPYAGKLHVRFCEGLVS